MSETSLWVQNDRKSPSSTSFFFTTSAVRLFQKCLDTKRFHIYYLRSKITLCFQHIRVVYMWIFGASPVAWTKSRPEWNASEKHLQSNLRLLHPSNHNVKVEWQYTKITEYHENPWTSHVIFKTALLDKKTKWIFLYIEICFQEAVWSQ